MVPVAWLGALWLRFNLGDIPDIYLYHALLDLATIVPIQVAVFWCFGHEKSRGLIVRSLAATRMGGDGDGGQ